MTLVGTQTRRAAKPKAKKPAPKNKPWKPQPKAAMRALMGQPAVTVEHAAVLLSMSRTGAYHAVRDGEIESFRVGSCIRIPSAWLRTKLGIAA